jgi:hypothetical protein
VALSAYLDVFNTGTGIAGTTIARSGYGFQPVAFLLWTTGRTETTDAGGSASCVGNIGLGVSATDRRCVAWYLADGGGNANSGTGRFNAAILMEGTGDTTTAGALDVQSVDSDGLTFVVDVQFTASLRVQVLAWGGSDVTAAATGSFDTGTSTGNQSISLGWQPSLVFFLSARVVTENTFSQDASWTFGVAQSNTARWCIGAFNNDNATTMATRRYGTPLECGVQVTAAATDSNVRWDFVSMDATGFTINRLEAGANTRVYYLALAGGAWAVGSLTTRTDGNDIAVTGLGFQPAGLLFGSHGTAASTQDTLDTHGMASLGAATSPTARGAHAYSDENGLGDAEVATFVEHDAVYIASDLADGVAALMDLKSLETTGFTTVMDTPEPSAGAFVGWVAGGNVVAPPAGRTTHNTRSQPLGLAHGLGFRIG